MKQAVSTVLLAPYVGALRSATSVRTDNTLQTIKFNPTYFSGRKTLMDSEARTLTIKYAILVHQRSKTIPTQEHGAYRMLESFVSNW
jgi:hypothetical protein